MDVASVMSEDDLKQAIIDIFSEYAYEFTLENGSFFGVSNEFNFKYADEIIALFRKQVAQENELIDKELL
jgi:hypothetical protein